MTEGEAAGTSVEGRRRRRRVPRPIRRALLLAGWASATALLTAETIASIRSLLG